MAIFNSFTFDEINSLTHGIYVTGEAVFNAPERVVEMIPIPGKDGALAIDQGYFSNIEVTYPGGCFADSMRDFADKVAEFRNILASRYSYVKLQDTYHPDEFRLALYKSGLEVSPVRYNSAAEFNITFECKPQRWLTSGQTQQSFTGNGTITNPTLFPSKPLIKARGTGPDQVLTIGSYTVSIIGEPRVSRLIYIDCETQEAWETQEGGGIISRNDWIRNAGEEFPVLGPGANAIGLSGGLSLVQIIPRWWRI